MIEHGLRLLQEDLDCGPGTRAAVDGVCRDAVGRAVLVLLADGPDPILREVAAALKTPEQREAAFSSCIAIVATDGKITPSEQRFLRTLREVLAIPIAQARELAGPLASIFT